PHNWLVLWLGGGGRDSLWSAIGLAIGLNASMDVFERLLAGANAMDRHFATAPFRDNMPVIMAAMHIWNMHLLQTRSRAVVSYEWALREFPPYLQQLDMESCGKSVQMDGRPVEGATGGVIWGGAGNNGQHAYYQLLHQGTQTIPCDFIVPLTPQRPDPEHDAKVLANAFGQAQAMMRGRTAEEARDQLRQAGVDDASDVERLVPHMVMPGNRPSNTIIYESLTPETLGALIALYEHKVFVQSVVWNINAFDQYGVELGKVLADDVREALTRPAHVEPAIELDASTARLIEYARGHRRYGEND
ncbi:MAG: glucose-6-phosphate isomerase, partial [Pseudomonadota bacterium]